MIKLILTNLISDKKNQREHDLKIVEWICGENENCITVFNLAGILAKEKKLHPEQLQQALIDFVKENKMEIILVDTSRDHYWRDFFEDSIEGLTVNHNPYPETLFQ